MQEYVYLDLGWFLLLWGSDLQADVEIICIEFALAVSFGQICEFPTINVKTKSASILLLVNIFISIFLNRIHFIFLLSLYMNFNHVF